VAALLSASHADFYESLDRVFTTAIWTEPAFATAKRFAATGRKLFYYHFARVSPGARANGQLAQHSCEIRYAFGTLTHDGFYDRTDVGVSEGVQHAWFSFARDGVPRWSNGEAFGAYEASNPVMTWIGDQAEQRPFEVTPLMAAMNARRLG
jgi:para-nitrobenzyl esterase